VGNIQSYWLLRHVITDTTGMSTDVLARCSLRLDFVSIMQTSLITCSRPQYFSLIRVNSRTRVRAPLQEWVHIRACWRMKPPCNLDTRSVGRLLNQDFIVHTPFQRSYLWLSLPSEGDSNPDCITSTSSPENAGTILCINWQCYCIPHTLQPAPASCENISNIWLRGNLDETEN
jgi:hypothetical protein